MCCRGEMDFVCEVVCKETHGDLALTVRVLVNRGGDDSFLEVRSHLGEEVRGDELYFSFKSARAESAANRKAVDGVHIKAIKCRETPEEVGRFLVAFVLVLAAFDHAYDFSSGAVAQKPLGKAVGFLAMILGREHPSNDSHFGARRNTLAHQFTRQV